MFLSRVLCRFSMVLAWSIRYCSFWNWNQQLSHKVNLALRSSWWWSRIKEIGICESWTPPLKKVARRLLNIQNERKQKSEQLHHVASNFDKKLLVLSYLPRTEVVGNEAPTNDRHGGTTCQQVSPKLLTILLWLISWWVKKLVDQVLTCPMTALATLFPGRHFMDILEPTIGNFIREVIPGAPKRQKAQMFTMAFWAWPQIHEGLCKETFFGARQTHICTLIKGLLRFALFHFVPSFLCHVF